MLGKLVEFTQSHIKQPVEKMESKLTRAKSAFNYGRRQPSVFNTLKKDESRMDATCQLLKT